MRASEKIERQKPGRCAAELLLRKPWMPGGSDFQQMGLICQNLGTPTEASWPDAKESLPHYLEFQKTAPPPLKTIFPKVSHISPSRSEMASNNSVYILRIHKVLLFDCFIPICQRISKKVPWKQPLMGT